MVGESFFIQRRRGGVNLNADSVVLNGKKHRPPHCPPQHNPPGNLRLQFFIGQLLAGFVGMRIAQPGGGMRGAKIVGIGVAALAQLREFVAAHRKQNRRSSAMSLHRELAEKNPPALVITAIFAAQAVAGRCAANSAGRPRREWGLCFWRELPQSPPFPRQRRRHKSRRSQ